MKKRKSNFTKENLTVLIITLVVFAVLFGSVYFEGDIKGTNLE